MTEVMNAAPTPIPSPAPPLRARFSMSMVALVAVCVAVALVERLAERMAAEALSALRNRMH